MLSTMRRGFAYVYWLPAIRMPQDHGPRVSGGQRVCPGCTQASRCRPRSQGGETPSPGGSKSARHLRIPLIHPSQRPDFPPIYKVLNSALFGVFSTPHPPLREGSLFGGRQRFWTPPPPLAPPGGFQTLHAPTAWLLAPPKERSYRMVQWHPNRDSTVGAELSRQRKTE